MFVIFCYVSLVIEQFNCYRPKVSAFVSSPSCVYNRMCVTTLHLLILPSVSIILMYTLILKGFGELIGGSTALFSFLCLRCSDLSWLCISECCCSVQLYLNVCDCDQFFDKVQFVCDWLENKNSHILCYSRLHRNIMTLQCKQQIVK